MKTSEKTENIYKDLIKTLPLIDNLFPSAKGHGYDYIPLQDVINEIKTKLKGSELYFVQFPISDDSNSIGVTTRIIHTSGEWIESTAYAPTSQNNRINEVQAVGSTITYLRRYSLTCAFGITGDTDNDAATPPPANNNKSNNNNNYSNNNNASSQDKEKLKEEIKKYKEKATQGQQTQIEDFLSNDPSIATMQSYITGFLSKNIKL